MSILPEKLNKTPHWSKKVFQKYGLSIGDVARALDLSYPYMSGLLTGNIRITPKQEKRIQELINYLEANYEL